MQRSKLTAKIFFLWYNIIEVNTAFSKRKKRTLVLQTACFVVNALKDAKVKSKNKTKKLFNLQPNILNERRVVSLSATIIRRRTKRTKMKLSA